MEFWGDDRGQSIQVGAVLLFGFLIIGLSIYQTSVVPAQNQEVEFNHNQEVQNDMVNLRSSVVEAAATGDTRSTVVKLGTRYPSRVMFVNPPPPTGYLTTQGGNTVEIRVDNATASGEDVGDFWNGTNHTFDTSVVSYRPGYNAYRSAPETVYENSIVYNAQGEATIPLTDDTLLDGKEITLLTVDGNLSRSGVSAHTVDVTPTSTSDNAVTVSNQTHNVTITIPTRLTESAWEDLLEAERDEAGGHLVGMNYTDGPGEFSLLTLELESGVEYRLRMAELGVGTGTTDPEPAYLVKERIETTEDGRTLVVEVRDRLGNPVEEGSVNVTLDGSGSLSAQGESDLDDVSVNEDGLVILTYEPDSADQGSTVRVNVSLDEAGSVAADDPRSTQFTFTGGDETGDGSVGTSGQTDHGEDQNQTISTAGGVWTNITDVNSINLEDPRFSPIRPSSGEVREDDRFFRLGFVLNNSTTEYTFVVGSDQDGLRYTQEPNSRAWQDKGIALLKYEEGSDPETLFDRDLSTAALNNWLEGEKLELLNHLQYENPDEVEPHLEEVRRFLNESDSSDPAQAFITDMTGRTEMSLVNETDDNEASLLKIGDADNYFDPTAVNAEGSSTDDYAAFKFALVNVMSNEQIESIDTVNFTIDAANGTVTRIENDQSGTGSYNYEFYFDGNNQAGYINGTLDTGTTEPLDQAGDIDSGSGVTVYVNEVRDDGTPVDLGTGDTVTITVEYTVDGEQYYQELTFEIKDRVNDK